MQDFEQIEAERFGGIGGSGLLPLRADYAVLLMLWRGLHVALVAAGKKGERVVCVGSRKLGWGYFFQIATALRMIIRMSIPSSE